MPVSVRLFKLLFFSGALTFDLKEFLEPKKYNFNYFDEDQIVEIDDETIEIDPDRDGLAPSFQLSTDYMKGFNFISLRSNFIIKWEYSPGSFYSVLSLAATTRSLCSHKE